MALLALDPLTRYLLREGLRRRGHEVTAVGDVHELLRAAQVQRFAVALLLVPPGAAPLRMARTPQDADPALLRELASTVHLLSPATQDWLRPFLLRRHAGTR